MKKLNNDMLVNLSDSDINLVSGGGCWGGGEGKLLTIPYGSFGSQGSVANVTIANAGGFMSLVNVFDGGVCVGHLYSTNDREPLYFQQNYDTKGLYCYSAGLKWAGDILKPLDSCLVEVCGIV